MCQWVVWKSKRFFTSGQYQFEYMKEISDQTRRHSRFMLPFTFKTVTSLDGHKIGVSDTDRYYDLLMRLIKALQSLRLRRHTHARARTHVHGCTHNCKEQSILTTNFQTKFTNLEKSLTQLFMIHFAVNTNLLQTVMRFLSRTTR